MFNICRAVENGIYRLVFKLFKRLVIGNISVSHSYTFVKHILDTARLPPEDIRTWAVAGGLGTSLTPANAQALGLLPPFPADRYLAPGNTALLGAEQLLLHPESEALLTTLHRNTGSFNLAETPDFMDRFVDAIPFETFGS